MEDGELSVVAPPSDKHKKTYGEILDELCVFYMSIGVTYEEFWYGDYTKLKYILKAYEMRQERELEKLNESCYLAGLYNYNAFSSVIYTFGWALGGKKGSKPPGYLTAPIPFTENEKNREKERNVQHTIKWFMEGQKD